MTSVTGLAFPGKLLTCKLSFFFFLSFFHFFFVVEIFWGETKKKITNRKVSLKHFETET